MSDNKVTFPGPGCLVEFMQGNIPMQAIVLDEQGARLRLYCINRRELSLQAPRLLPWSGPNVGSGLSRQNMDAALEEHKNLRASIAAGISPLEVWELTQGEVGKASAQWLAGLLWVRPTVDQEAALGHALLSAKAHFRFTPPEFEIFNRETVDRRLAEAESTRLREAFAVTGAQFFQKLWDIHTKKRGPLTSAEQPDESLLDQLKELLFERIADPEASASAACWKLLTKSLPENPHLALLLAEAWGLVPAHYNFWLDRAGFDKGDAWADAFSAEATALADQTAKAVTGLPKDDTPYVSIDPCTTTDRDDAFFVRRTEDGGFLVKAAFACPALAWPFGSELDKAVQRRASSLYLPEGDEHMLPAHIGRQLFSLDQGCVRPVFTLAMRLSASGQLEEVVPAVTAADNLTNLSLEASEAMFTSFAENGASPESACPAPEKMPLYAMLGDALRLARLLQENRIAGGAVITERPDPEVVVTGKDDALKVRIDQGPEARFSHLVVGEIMVLSNAAVATFGKEHAIPLLYRTQDVALPREFSGVWTQPHDISRVVRALPPASLETVPRKHAGLGIAAYATASSPIRRYTDLINQGQLLHYIQDGHARLDQQALVALQPFLSARSDAVTLVQRQRPRYWKLLFFKQQGDKKWWDAVVSDENEAFATISLPWAYLMVRGKRRQFDDKLYPGMPVQVRLGKINPLLGEIQVLEAREM
ncbi:RNB domain-containing ribonuclease [Desulfovibrio sp. OttesenSCG-928-G15]|nr:RNB domain-containing ribonuclease [Desulfovibrio sp. OttesenSCG-928-G15]